MNSHAQAASAVGGGRNRRKKYVVNASFQWKYALMTAIVVFLVTSILASVLYGLLHQQARMRVMNPETYTAEVSVVVLMFGVAFAGISAIGVGVWSILVTHRFCGPLFVIEKHLKSLAAGRMPKLRDLRRKDELKEFYAEFRRTVDALRDRRTTQAGALADALAEARTGLDADHDGCRQTLESLIQRLGSLQHDARAGLIAPDERSADEAVTDPAGTGSPVPQV
jgi:hypothetical protein